MNSDERAIAELDESEIVSASIEEDSRWRKVRCKHERMSTASLKDHLIKLLATQPDEELDSFDSRYSDAEIELDATLRILNERGQSIDKRFCLV